LATEPSPQRSYRAACPNCGAPVDFRSAASASAVCSFCRSTLLREGDALRRIGQSAELFDDHSPLQLGASGRYQGAAFTLVGRLQYSYAEGIWNEWHALFDSGGAQKSAWLSEDNGAYVLSFEAPLVGEVPTAEELSAGERRLVAGLAWDVASVTRAKLLAAQGELPHPPNLSGEFVVADLRNERAEVGTLDYADPAQPTWSIGRAVALSELAMTGLAEGTEKTLKGRSAECPSCGTSLQITLDSTQSIVCQQCHAVVDLSQGVGADLKHYAQAANTLEPLLPLGSSGVLTFGKLGPLPWQVVGYMERCDVPDGDDEQTFWREYLLYNQRAGFAFLVDTEDGWSWVRPLTGTPTGRGERLQFEGDSYQKRYSYPAKVTYVLGEFYWRVTRDQRSLNTDYQGQGSAARKQLNREETGSEVTWSAGEKLDASAVARAFKLPDDRLAALQRDAAPTGLGDLGDVLGSAGGLLKPLLIFGLLVIVIIAVTRCGSDDCDAYRDTYGVDSAEYKQCQRGGGTRTSGGSYGGFSSGGGGHK